jgi:hypothetical protein
MESLTEKIVTQFALPSKKQAIGPANRLSPRD